ncbi:hypothetical protein V8Z74_15100 [Comamonas sp. w2-DMI]|uniref:hypothetical protein n=1 Tax=Comamonas sp. w2-DMI TaxID=3126391 RepID=UPI0032E47DE8
MHKLKPPLYSGRRSSQMGYGIVSVMLGLMVTAIVANGIVQSLNYRDQSALGVEYAKRINPVRIATNQYVSENYDHLQSGEPITRNGVTLSPGDSVGQTMSPRVEDLIALKYLPEGFNTQIPLRGPGTSLITKLRREPAGCVAQDCEIPGFIYLSQAILRNSTEANGVLIGAYRRETGPDALISLNTSPTLLTSGQGMTAPNLVSGTPPGVIGILVGWGASDFGQYLVMNDSRDPNFRGNLTVKGIINSETKVIAPVIVGEESVGAGTGNNGSECRLAELTKLGEVISRVSSCLKKVVIEPTKASITTFFGTGVQSVAISGEDSTVTLNKATGVQTIRMTGNTSEILLNNSAGTSRLALNGESGTIAAGNTSGTRTARINGDTGQIASSDGMTDRFAVDNSGNLRVRAAGGSDKAGFDVADGSGRAFGEVLKPTLRAAKGSGCGTGRSLGDMAQNTLGPGLLMCNGSVWVPITSVSGSQGSWCQTNGELGQDPTGVSMICSGNQWVPLAERFGKRIFVASYSASNGTSVPKPACLSGTYGSIIILSPKNIFSEKNSVNFFAIDYGSSWLVNITDNAGNGISGESIASIYCLYS